MPPLAYGKKGGRILLSPPSSCARKRKWVTLTRVTLRALQRAQINESDRNRSSLPSPPPTVANRAHLRKRRSNAPDSLLSLVAWSRFAARPRNLQLISRISKEGGGKEGCVCTAFRRVWKDSVLFWMKCLYFLKYRNNWIENEGKNFFLAGKRRF